MRAPGLLSLIGLAALLPGPGAYAKPAVPKLVHELTITEYAPDRKLANPQGVAVDRATGEIYVTDSGNGQVVVFSRDGLPRYRFPHLVESANGGKEQPGEPFGIALGPGGEIFLSDNRSSKIDVMDYRGRKLRSLELGPWVDKGQPSPGKLAVDSAGVLYVIERTTAQVLAFDRDMRLVHRFGGRGREPGKFTLPNSIFLARSGRIYVSDAQAMPVQIFEPGGKLVAVCGSHDSSPQGFSFPCGVVADPQGRIWVADRFRQEIKLFGPDLEHVANWGGLGRNNGDLFFPSDLEMDPDGTRFYLPEGAANQVKIFRAEFPEGARAK